MDINEQQSQKNAEHGDPEVGGVGDRSAGKSQIGAGRSASSKGSDGHRQFREAGDQRSDEIMQVGKN